MDYRQLLSAYGYPSPAYQTAAAANNARTYSYRLWTLANVLSEPCPFTSGLISFLILGVLGCVYIASDGAKQL